MIVSQMYCAGQTNEKKRSGGVDWPRPASRWEPVELAATFAGLVRIACMRMCMQANVYMRVYVWYYMKITLSREWICWKLSY